MIPSCDCKADLHFLKNVTVLCNFSSGASPFHNSLVFFLLSTSFCIVGSQKSGVPVIFRLLLVVSLGQNRPKAELEKNYFSDGKF